MLICSQLQLVLVGTNAATFPPQYYWKSMLPNSPMPKAITDLLHPGQYHTLKLMSMYTCNFTSTCLISSYINKIGSNI